MATEVLGTQETETGNGLPMLVKDVPDRIMQTMKQIRSPKFLKQLKYLKSQRVDKLLRERAIKLRQQWRKVVTGDEQKRIRDYVQDFGDRPNYIKFFDKVLFTYGIVNIVACEYFLLKSPSWFWLWYLLVFPLIVFSRVVHYHGRGLEYFLIDFCYFVSTASIVDLLLFAKSQYLFKFIFIYANGPLLWAIVIWRNSMVFHDFDKMTSVYIHMLPSMLTYVARAHGHYMCLGKLTTLLGLGECNVSQLTSFTSPITLWDYGAAAMGYILWQSGYFVQTEIIDKDKLDKNPHKVTSLRWITQDTNNSFARTMLRLFRMVGLFGRTEDYDPDSKKTKAVFILTQFVYTIVTFFPTFILYHNASLHLFFITFVFAISVFYGASFYIEVFAKRYAKSLEKMEVQNAAMATMSVALNDALLVNASACTKSPKTKKAVSSTTIYSDDGSSTESLSNMAKAGMPLPNASSGSLSLGSEGLYLSESENEIQYRGDLGSDLDHSHFRSTEELIDDILSQS
jgi:hypothetical protein